MKINDLKFALRTLKVPTRRDSASANALSADPGKVAAWLSASHVEKAPNKESQHLDGDGFDSMSDRQVPFSHSDIDGRTFYHGTKAKLKPGDMLQGGYSSNYTERRSPWIYFSETGFAATWGAELAKGEGPGRIYVVEPTGPFMDDPNVTDRKFPGNPTKSYRSKDPLRVVSEHLDWQGHSPEEIQAMKDFIADKEPIDD